jgi:hypothetical protein
MKLQMLCLHGDSDRRRPEDRDALPGRPSHARVMNPCAAGLAQFARKRLACPIVVRIEQNSPLLCIQPCDVVQFSVDAPDENAHVLVARPVPRVGCELPEMLARFGDRRRQIGRGIIGAVRRVRKTPAPRIEMRERRHHVAGTRPAHAFLDGNETNVAGLVAHARIGQHLCGDQRLPYGLVRRDAFVEIDGRIARSDDSGCCPPKDSP